ncbi:hypothetical protein POM88_033768 [Heracleum sosnowskyi]|uniref:Transposase n=1 Tax=Heracleum sosnowskyi TaxID=360622 RepID=A0AAD8HJE9_9APIA|nr:hypothetical protein POM88_033768 [Heracleum sosnowskyi]
MCKIHVFHSWSTVDPPNVEEEGENENVIENEIVEKKSDPTVNLNDNESLGDMFEKVCTDDDNGENAHKSGDNMDAEGTEKGNAVRRSKKYTARNRVINVKGTYKGNKKINVDSGIDDSGDGSWYDNEDESANESSDVGDLNDNYSDEEFADMRTIREEIRKEHDQLFKEQSQLIKDSLVGYKNTDEGMFNDNNLTYNADIYGIGSQEESDVDENYAYLGPSTIGKNKRVNEPFNPCTAGKDIKWRCALIFGSKQELKTVVMEFSIATGRPLRYCVDIWPTQDACGSGYGYTFISDQQKGLLKAVRELLPCAEHRNCTRHFYANLQGKSGSEAVRNASYQASYATHPTTFKEAIKCLEKASKKVATKMNEFDLKVWSKAYFQTNSKTDSTKNNISESFNSWILRIHKMKKLQLLLSL